MLYQKSQYGMLLAPFELYRALIIKVFLLPIKEHKKPQPWHVLDFTDGSVKTTQFAFVLQTNMYITLGIHFCFLLL